MRLFLSALLITFCSIVVAQPKFTRQDSLRGSITHEREWWDLNYYHLQVKVDPSNKYISGSTTIRYKVLESNNRLQVDLQPPLVLDSVTQDGIVLQVESEGNAHFVSLVKDQSKDSYNEVIAHYSGNPKEAIRAPWDGGFSWKKDANGLDFVATSCQGLGASVWWPCKDHMYDEPDSMMISVTVPQHLMDVSNGRLLSVDQNQDSTKTYNWFVQNPINNYGVNVNIGDYVKFGEKYEGEKGTLDMDYYVLRDNLEKAKKQFKQAPLMMDAFEHWFGPYPFYEDGFKLVEVPYLGMEHQSSVTYGNRYGNGYLGRDLSQTGWGLKFDFIIIHESGHEWFANNITYKDCADMWVHEGFTNYSENLYLDYHFGKKASSEYVIGTRKVIQNDIPIIGYYGVNQEGSSDMYYKGGNLLHTLRTILNDDEKWRQILRGLNETFYHQTVTTQQIEDYINERFEADLASVFDQYLRTTQIPELELTEKGKKLYYKWTNCIDNFEMPVDILVDGEPMRVNATTSKQSVKVPDGEVYVDPNYYVGVKE
ncbi:MAG: M1 family metallopeptidase [bacterium]|nr:M1 family metallopeptidase [bacterium]